MNAGVVKLNEVFGLNVKRDKFGMPIPPPPNVLRVLTEMAYRTENPSPRHGPRALRQKSKNRRLRRRMASLRRTTLRSTACILAGTSSRKDLA